MHLRIVALAVFLLISQIPAPVAAQDAPEPPVPPSTGGSASARFNISGRAGISFGSETVTDWLAGVEFGGEVLRHLQLYGAFDWHADVMPNTLYVEALGHESGHTMEVSFPAYVAMAGAKYVFAPGQRVRPYAMGGFGACHIRSSIAGVTFDTRDLGQDGRTTKPMFEVGWGAAVSSGRTFVDMGYRFRKGLNMDGQLNVSGVHVGAGIAF